MHCPHLHVCLQLSIETKSPSSQKRLEQAFLYKASSEGGQAHRECCVGNPRPAHLTGGIGPGIGSQWSNSKATSARKPAKSRSWLGESLGTAAISKARTILQRDSHETPTICFFLKTKASDHYIHYRYARLLEEASAEAGTFKRAQYASAPSPPRPVHLLFIGIHQKSSPLRAPPASAHGRPSARLPSPPAPLRYPPISAGAHLHVVITASGIAPLTEFVVAVLLK